MGDISVVSLRPALKEGWLTKQGGSIKTWKRRWFVLKEDTFWYFTCETAKSPKGCIPLQTAKGQQVAIFDANATKPFSFQIKTPSSERTWYIIADNEQEKREWMEILTRITYNPSAEYGKIPCLTNTKHSKISPKKDKKQKSKTASPTFGLSKSCSFEQTSKVKKTNEVSPQKSFINPQEYSPQRSATMMHKSASDNSIKEAFYGDLPKKLEGPAAPSPEYGGLPVLSSSASSVDKESSYGGLPPKASIAQRPTEYGSLPAKESNYGDLPINHTNNYGDLPIKHTNYGTMPVKESDYGGLPVKHAPAKESDYGGLPSAKDLAMMRSNEYGALPPLKETNYTGLPIQAINCDYGGLPPRGGNTQQQNIARNVQQLNRVPQQAPNVATSDYGDLPSTSQMHGVNGGRGFHGHCYVNQNSEYGGLPAVQYS